MNSRERVIKALNFQEPDRVPFDATFTYDAFHKMVDHLGLNLEQEVPPRDPFLSIVAPVEFLEAMNIDLCYLSLAPGADAQPFTLKQEVYVDEWGITYRMKENNGVMHTEFTSPPLADASIEDLEDYPWPDPYDPARIDGLAENSHYLYENTWLALVGRYNTPIFEQAFLLRGLEKWLLDLAVNPDFACALMDKLTDIAIGLIEAGLKASGNYLQILRLAGDDLGAQQNTLISPKMFRDLIKPRFARLYKSAKEMMHAYNPDMKLMAHSDGDIYAFIPDYLEMGLDILNPVQPYVAHMEHDRIKKNFGDKLAFHAGIDIQRVLPFGTVEEVTSEVRKTINALGPGGGYILAPSHYIQPDAPMENIIALRDATLKYGQYPLA